jgi:transcription elongation factor Elf1
VTGARGARHKDRKKVTCPRCHTADLVEVTGPPVDIKGIEKVPALCGACRHRWHSENRAIMALAK